jgi:hypothetical protein
MAEPERSRCRARVALGLFAAVAFLTACKSVSDAQPGTAPLPPQTLVSPPTPEPAAASAPAQPPPAAVVSEPPRKMEEKAQTLIVIEPAEPLEAPPSQDLAAAARREKERRTETRQPIAVINQKNLASYAAGGVLTQTEEPPEPTAEESAAAAAIEQSAAEEAYWRKRGREIRQRWHDAEERIAVLEAKAASLRNRYYSTDDGYLRDSQIKPEWDKAIADLEEARFQASRGATEVRTFLEEGRRAGALPGWLRDGVELEPEPVLETVDEAGTELEATEPVIYRDPASDDEPESEDDEPPSGDDTANG